MKSFSALSAKLLASALLLTAIGLVSYAALRPLPPPTLTQPLATLVPFKIEGWSVKDQPIADTEEMKKAVGETLNYDDAVYRTYTQGNTTISVYVAYWKAGKMSPRLIASHTPDVCWVGGGWKCTYRDFAYQVSLTIEANSFQLLTHSTKLTAQSSSIQLKPAQAGTYELADNVQHVLFWHLHHGEIIAYNTGKQPPWYAALADLWSGGFNQRGEQFFIRIASNVPITEAIKTKAMRNTLQTLVPNGLKG